MGNDLYGALATGQVVNPHLSTVFYMDRECGVKRPLNFPCQKIDAGYKFSVLLDNRGALFVAGNKDDRAFHIVHELLDRDIRLIDVCCTWSKFIALDANGNAHLGTIMNSSRIPELLQLNFFAPVVQIGAGQVHFYVRTTDLENSSNKSNSNSKSDSIIFKFPEYAKGESKQNSLVHPERLALKYAEELSTDLGDHRLQFVQLTGTYITTVIHQAYVHSDSRQLTRQLHHSRRTQQLCDTIIQCIG